MEDVAGRGPASEQAQAQSSILLGEMGEERQDCSVVNKIIMALLTPCSPEALTAPMPPTTLSPPVFCRLFDEPVLKTTTEQRAYDVVMIKNEGINVIRLPQDRVTEVLPVPSQSTSPHQPLDDLLLAEMTPGRHGPHAFNHGCQMSNSRLPEDEAAQKQSEVLKTSSREGACLERAAAYVRERLSKHLPNCDAFPSRSGVDTSPKAIEAGAREQNRGTVSKETTDAEEHIPHATVAPTLPAASLACPIQAGILCRLPDGPSTPSLSLVDNGYMTVSEIARAVLTPCSSQAEWSPVPSAPVSPASPNNKDQSIASFKTVNDDAYEAETEACHRTRNAVSKGDKTDGTRLFEVECEGAGSPYTYAGAVIRRPAPNNAAGLPKAKAWGGNQELLMKMLEEEKKRPDQEAISKMEASGWPAAGLHPSLKLRA
ncbi:hypothetical protein AX14_009153 [Amanita brunnescens Koide BX004]|nr:hypothetical protein AX14_009153 [Amanita brunnescens Koide BX004]